MRWNAVNKRVVLPKGRKTTRLKFRLFGHKNILVTQGGWECLCNDSVGNRDSYQLICNQNSRINFTKPRLERDLSNVRDDHVQRADILHRPAVFIFLPRTTLLQPGQLSWRGLKRRSGWGREWYCPLTNLCIIQPCLLMIGVDFLVYSMVQRGFYDNAPVSDLLAGALQQNKECRSGSFRQAGSTWLHRENFQGSWIAHVDWRIS